MDKDRIEGAGKELKGRMKDSAGSATNDQQMQAEGKFDKAEGKVQQNVGKAKDKFRDPQSR